MYSVTFVQMTKYGILVQIDCWFPIMTYGGLIYYLTFK